MTVFTRRETNTLLNFASFATDLRTACRLRDMFLFLKVNLLYCECYARLRRSSVFRCAAFRTLHAVLRTADTPLLDTRSVERSTDNMISDTRQIFDASAAHQDDRVFLQVMAFVRNIGDHFVAVGQPDFCDLAHRRVWFLRRTGHDLNANSA